MYVARFSYDFAPANRQQALDFLHKELKAAQASGLHGRILVPLTRSPGSAGAALQFEVDLTSLDQLDQFRNQSTSVGAADAHRWIHDFSKILTAPPAVEILRAETLHESADQVRA